MADHFAKEIAFIMFSIMFLVVMLGFWISDQGIIESDIKEIAIEDESDFNTNWIKTGENFRAIE